MADWVTPVYDRTQEDVEFAAKMIAEWIAAEISGTPLAVYDLKGCLNLRDINRIEGNIAYLSKWLTDLYYNPTANSKQWANLGIPTNQDIQRILSNLQAIRDSYYVPDEAPAVPSQMATYSDINAIEKNLYLINELIEVMVGSFKKVGTFQANKTGVLPLSKERGGYLGADYYYTTEIGANQFRDMTDITWASLVMPNLTTIGDNAFNGCTNLALTELPESLTTIGVSAFYACENLRISEIPGGVTNLPEYVFAECRSIESMVIPSGVTAIGTCAFYGCSSLASVTFEGTPSLIESNAFANCMNLTEINVPWAHDEVAGAPWGATNAIINYSGDSIEINGTPMLNEATVEFTGSSTPVSGFSLTVGLQYYVIWNGKVYEDSAKDMDGEIYIGNYSLVISGLGEADYPFCILTYGGNGGFVFKETSGAETVTLSIIRAT